MCLCHCVEYLSSGEPSLEVCSGSAQRDRTLFHLPAETGQSLHFFSLKFFVNISYGLLLYKQAILKIIIYLFILILIYFNYIFIYLLLLLYCLLTHFKDGLDRPNGNTLYIIYKNFIQFITLLIIIYNNYYNVFRLTFAVNFFAKWKYLFARIYYTYKNYKCYNQFIKVKIKVLFFYCLFKTSQCKWPLLWLTDFNWCLLTVWV